MSQGAGWQRELGWQGDIGGGFSSARSLCFHHRPTRLPLMQHFLQETQWGWQSARLRCYPTLHTEDV